MTDPHTSVDDRQKALVFVIFRKSCNEIDIMKNFKSKLVNSKQVVISRQIEVTQYNTSLRYPIIICRMSRGNFKQKLNLIKYDI